LHGATSANAGSAGCRAAGSGTAPASHSLCGRCCAAQPCAGAPARLTDPRQPPAGRAQHDPSQHGRTAQHGHGVLLPRGGATVPVPGPGATGVGVRVAQLPDTSTGVSGRTHSLQSGAPIIAIRQRCTMSPTISMRSHAQRCAMAQTVRHRHRSVSVRAAGAGEHRSCSGHRDPSPATPGALHWATAACIVTAASALAVPEAQALTIHAEPANGAARMGGNPPHEGSGSLMPHPRHATCSRPCARVGRCMIAQPLCQQRPPAPTSSLRLQPCRSPPGRSM